MPKEKNKEEKEIKTVFQPTLSESEPIKSLSSLIRHKEEILKSMQGEVTTERSTTLEKELEALLIDIATLESKEEKEHKDKKPVTLTTTLSARTRLESKRQGARVTPTPALTLIAKAKQDCARCKALADYWYCPGSRLLMADYLLEKVHQAEITRYDDELTVAYEAIQVMMQGWWGSAEIKAIIQTTRNQLKENQLLRQHSPQFYAKERELRLREVEQERDDALAEVEALESELERTKASHKTTLEAKSKLIQLKTQSNITLSTQLAKVQAELAAYQQAPKSSKEGSQGSHAFFQPQSDFDKKREPRPDKPNVHKYKRRSASPRREV